MSAAAPAPAPAPAPARRHRGLRRSRIWRRFTAHRPAMAGALVVLFFTLVAVLAPLIAPYDPNATDWGAVRKAPSVAHWLGTDELGRDLLSRVIWGARASLLAGFVSVAIAFMIGVPLGMISGWAGGWLDNVLMRVVDAFLAIPFLILAIALAAFLGPSLTNAMIAIGISTAPVFARIARGQTLVVKVEEYIEAAHALGTSGPMLLVRHVFINITPQLVVQATLAIATAIIAEAALAFLGLGQQPPDASWGSMLNAARASLTLAPWMAIWPGMAIFLTVLGFNLLGDGLQDALEVKE